MHAIASLADKPAVALGVAKVNAATHSLPVCISEFRRSASVGVGLELLRGCRQL